MTLLNRSDDGHICTLTLNSPDTYNALSDQMMAALQTECDTLKSDKTIRVIILAAKGKAFCAGHNLKEMTAARQNADQGEPYFKDLFARCATLMQTIQSLPQPVIAQVQGVATAAGCQLVATCDMAVASETARFGVNGVNIGLFCSTPMVALSRNIPRKAAFELLTTGRFASADEARTLGLINKVTAPDALAAETQALAQKIAEKLSAAVAIGKEAFYNQLHLPLDQAYAYTAQVMAQNMMMEDTAEGISAFLEKRQPDWPQ